MQLKNKVQHCAYSGRVPHMNTSGDTRELSQAVPNLTLPTFNASLTVHSFTDIFTLTKILLPTDGQ